MTEVELAAGNPNVAERRSNVRPRGSVPAEQSALFAKFPLLFRAVASQEVHPSNIGNFGIQCGTGWYPLIEEAARLIEHELLEMSRNQLVQSKNIAALEHAVLMENTGKPYPVLPLCTDIQQVNGALAIVIVQGFLVDPVVWQRVLAVVHATREKSRAVCENCGVPGKMRPVYWRHVYCEDCIAPIGPLDDEDE
ncbi:hypothetical protein [Paraburkholderia sp. JHI869]|uniref:hypothetical protein n=1 Tax=Paraburkholderia sp. JHI869 TaxID=3112959 RepID=UPI0031792F8C